MPAPANPPALSLEHFIPYRLSVLANTVSSALAGAYPSRFGLTIPQWRVIAVLARVPGLSAADVAERRERDAQRGPPVMLARLADEVLDLQNERLR